MFNKVATSSARLFATKAPLYPFSKIAYVPQAPPDPPTDALRKGKGLMAHLSKGLIPPEKRHMMDVMFSRRHPERLLPGSVINVNLTHAPFSFSGVLLSTRRRGPDTNFVLRNVVQRTGVEMQFFVNSPDVQSIEVIQKAGGKGGRDGKRMRRAKLFYLRDSPEKMTAISAAMKR